MLSILYASFYIYLGIAGVALTVRRLHDVGLSGLWYYIPLILIIILYIIIYFSSDAYYAFDYKTIEQLGNFAISILCISVLGFFLCFIFMFFKSVPKQNKWGDSPTIFYEFIPASMKYFTKWLDFKGRSRRSEYWWIYLTLLLILIIEIIINSLIN